MAELAWTRALAKVVRAMAGAADAAIAFEGPGAQDLVVSDEM